MIQNVSNYKSLGIGVLIVALLIPLMTFAFQGYGGDSVNVSSDEAIEDDVYASGGSVSSSAKIEGDLNIAGGNVSTSGEVTEDVHAAGGNVTINGSVGDDLRIAGGNLNLNGDVGDDVIAAGGSLIISDIEIGGDLRAFAGRVQLGSTIEKSAEIAAEEVTITGTINGDVSIQAERVTISDSATIAGDLEYPKSANANIAEGVVEGSITKIDKPAWQRGNQSDGFEMQSFLTKLLMALVSALVIGLVFRRNVTQIVSQSVEKIGASLGIGLLGLIFIPVVAVLLMITIVGVPLGVLMFFAYAAHMAFGIIAIPILLGSMVGAYANGEASYRVTWWNILLGVLILQVVLIIPVVGKWIGGILSFILLLMILGSLWQTIWRALFKTPSNAREHTQSSDQTTAEQHTDSQSQ